MTPYQILDTINFVKVKEEDSRLLNAVIAYTYSAVIEEKRTKGPYNVFNMDDIVSSCTTNLLNRCSEYDINNATYIAVINHSAKTTDICKHIDSPEGIKEFEYQLKRFHTKRGF